MNYGITVPSDLIRLGKLENKLLEYRERLDGIYPQDGLQSEPLVRHPHNLMSEAILSRLLERGTISFVDLENEVKEKYGGEFDGYHFRNAFSVITDYVETGGANVSAGTGLK